MATAEIETKPAMNYLLLRGDAERIPLPDQSVDLVFGSPPYVDARLYLEDGKDLGIARNCLAWVEWMLAITAEAQRVSRGPVLWVAAGKTKDRNYWPACEGLMWEWWKRGGESQIYRPCYWHRVGIPGSGGDQWFRSDVEYVMCFKRPGKLPWSDNTAMGHLPKYAPGGAMSNRNADGRRTNSKAGAHNSRNAFGVMTDRPVGTRATGTKNKNSRNETYRAHTKRQQNGEMREQSYGPPIKANPGNLIQGIAVGGGHLGSKLAHENEAPFPEALAEHFIRSLCPPGGIVLDPFSGSGTTASVACRTGRQGIGLDLRQSQCELGQRRIVEDLTKPPVKIIKKRRPASPKEYLPLFDRGSDGSV